jgi:hypothetical protein
MIEKKILKGYLLHFIYIPVAVIYSIYQGEDFNVLSLIFLLSLIIENKLIRIGKNPKHLLNSTLKITNYFE